MSCRALGQPAVPSDLLIRIVWMSFLLARCIGIVLLCCFFFLFFFCLFHSGSFIFFFFFFFFGIGVISTSKVMHNRLNQRLKGQNVAKASTTLITELMVVLKLISLKRILIFLWLFCYTLF